MSIKREEEIACPKCGKTQTVTIWESIDAAPDPEARTALFEARVNRFDCPACDFDALVPLLQSKDPGVSKSTQKV